MILVVGSSDQYDGKKAINSFNFRRMFIPSSSLSMISSYLVAIYMLMSFYH
jgi:hypothetical protein